MIKYLDTNKGIVMSILGESIKYTALLSGIYQVSKDKPNISILIALGGIYIIGVTLAHETIEEYQKGKKNKLEIITKTS